MYDCIPTHGLRERSIGLERNSLPTNVTQWNSLAHYAAQDLSMTVGPNGTRHMMVALFQPMCPYWGPPKWMPYLYVGFFLGKVKPWENNSNSRLLLLFLLYPYLISDNKLLFKLPKLYTLQYTVITSLTLNFSSHSSPFSLSPSSFKLLYGIKTNEKLHHHYLFHCFNIYFTLSCIWKISRN